MVESSFRLPEMLKDKSAGNMPEPTGATFMVRSADQHSPAAWNRRDLLTQVSPDFAVFQTRHFLCRFSAFNQNFATRAILTRAGMR
jgi:hypothetical protein